MPAMSPWCAVTSAIATSKIAGRSSRSGTTRTGLSPSRSAAAAGWRGSTSSAPTRRAMPSRTISTHRSMSGVTAATDRPLATCSFATRAISPPMAPRHAAFWRSRSPAEAAAATSTSAWGSRKTRRELPSGSEARAAKVERRKASPSIMTAPSSRRATAQPRSTRSRSRAAAATHRPILRSALSCRRRSASRSGKKAEPVAKPGRSTSRPMGFSERSATMRMASTPSRSVVVAAPAARLPWPSTTPRERAPIPRPHTARRRTSV